MPAGDAEHMTYSKRAMAQDCLAVMRALGHERFMVAGHDRGGRVAYRLALDHPEAVSALIPVDIVPTAEVWRRTTAERAISAYHWAFLAQPFPLPETLIGKDPVYYLEHTLKSWAKSGDLSHFSAEALAHYRALLQEPARVHAVCEDYRAGATIDWQLDEADLAAGRKIACPTFLLWGSDYLGRGGAKPLDVWRAWCTASCRVPRSSRATSWPRRIPRTRWRRCCRSSPPRGMCDDGCIRDWDAVHRQRPLAPCGGGTGRGGLQNIASGSPHP